MLENQVQKTLAAPFARVFTDKKNIPLAVFRKARYFAGGSKRRKFFSLSFVPGVKYLPVISAAKKAKNGKDLLDPPKNNWSPFFERVKIRVITFFSPILSGDIFFAFYEAERAGKEEYFILFFLLLPCLNIEDA